MKKLKLFYIPTFLILAMLFLIGCQNSDQNGTKNTYESHATEQAGLRIKDQSAEYGINTELAAISANEDQSSVTEEFLEGTWVCKEGFVCSYKDDVFIDADGMQYSDFKIRNGYGIGTSIRGEVVPFHIEDKEEDAIVIDDVTAVRAESKKGKEYLSKLGRLLVNKWLLVGDADYKYMQFKDNNTLITTDMYEERLVYKYEYRDARIIVLSEDETDHEDLYFQISGDTLSLFYDGERKELYRNDSQTAKDAESGKLLLVGDKVFVTEDGKEIEKWTFDSENTLTIDSYRKQTSTKQIYTVYHDENDRYLSYGNNNYCLSKDNKVLYLYDQSKNKKMGQLYPADSKEGVRLIQKAETKNKEGEVINRTFSKLVNSKSFPAVFGVTLTLDCKSNLWLENYISVEELYTAIVYFPPLVGNTYVLKCNTELKNAVLTFTYDKERLSYDCKEEELVIVHIKNGNRVDPCEILPSICNPDDHTVSANITEDGIYYLADSSTSLIQR